MEKRNYKLLTNQTLFEDEDFLQINESLEENNPNKPKMNLKMFSISQLMYPYCQELGVNNECKRCVKGYSMKYSKGVCHRKKSKSSKNCEIFESKNICEVCVRGYYLKNGECILAKTFESDSSNVVMVQKFNNKVNDYYVQTKNNLIRLTPDLIGTTEDQTIIRLENTQNESSNENEKENKEKTEEESKEEVSPEKGTDSKDTTLEQSDQNLYLKAIETKPEEFIDYENVTILNNNSNKILFPNYRSYMLEREYQVKSATSDKVENQKINYLMTYLNGEISMAFDKNASKTNGPQIELNEEIISQNCSKIQLRGDQDRSLPVCLECVNYDKYFLRNYSNLESEVQLCVPRKKFLINCSQYDPNSDLCALCKTNYFLFSDSEQQLCIEAIPFCKEHSISLSPTCKICQENYILINRKCVQKEVIANCKAQEDNHCLACDEGFVLFRNLCINKVGFSFFSCPLDGNRVCSCGDFSSQIVSLNECVPIKADNCLEYENQSSCKKCRNGYYLNNSKICLEGEIPFCKEYGDLINGMQICSICEDNYVLEVNTCREALPLFTNNCLEKVGENCVNCSNSTYRVNLYDSQIENRLSSLQICAKNVFFDAYSNIKDCLIFDNVLNRCSLCKPGFWVLETGNCGVCDFSISGIDHTNTTCITPSQLVPGCELYEGNFCIKCRNSNQPKIYHDTLFTTSRRIYSDRAQNTYIEDSSFIVNQCEVNLDNSCRTDFCDSAITLSNGQLCCLRCQFSRSGAWLKFNDEYFTNSCSELIDFCDGSVKYKGIEGQFLKFITCHQCLENRIVNLNLIEGMLQTSCLLMSNQPNLENCLIMFESQCYICKPKYRKIVDANEEFIECQEIENCSLSETVDKCEQCTDGYSLDDSGENCILAPIPNCVLVDNNLQCIQCRDGLILHSNNCFKVDQPLCEKFKNGNCVRCQEISSSDSVNILINLNLEFQNEFTYSEKSFCLSPSNSLLNPSISNCEEYDTFNFCKKCAYSFILKQEQNKVICVQDPLTTTSCKMLNSLNNCIKCQDGLYLEADRCFQGKIQGCKEYIDQLNCSLCDDKFVLYSYNNRKICFYDHKIENCTKSLATQLPNSNKLQIDCLKCENNFRKNQFILSNPICFPLRLIANCKTLSNQSNDCQECDDLYFLNSERKCVKRTNLSIHFCEILNPQGDNCLSCMVGYNLQIDKLKCLSNEIKVLTGCKIHAKEKMECLVCDDLHFLNKIDFSCESVIEPVSNCVEYSSNKICFKCKLGYELIIEKDKQICKKEKVQTHSNLLVQESSKKTAEVIFEETINGNNTSSNQSNINERSVSSINIIERPQMVDVQNSEVLIDQLNDLETPKDDNSESNIDFGFNEDEFNQPRLLSNIEKESTLRRLQSEKTVTNVCGLCEEGFIYSSSKGKCIEIDIKGCMIKSDDQCKICKSGYFQIDDGSCKVNYQSGIQSSVGAFEIIWSLLIFKMCFNMV
jgi:hypothetical protein